MVGFALFNRNVDRYQFVEDHSVLSYQKMLSYGL